MVAATPRDTPPCSILRSRPYSCDLREESFLYDRLGSQSHPPDPDYVAVIYGIFRVTAVNHIDRALIYGVDFGSVMHCSLTESR